MKTHYQSFLLFLISIALPILAILIGDRTLGETAQYGNAEESTDRLDPKNLQDLQDEPGAQRAAKEGVQILLQLLKDDQTRAEELGFEADISFLRIQESAKPLPLANAFRIYTVRLNDLRAFAPGKNAESLLSDTRQLLVPIEVENQVMSSVTIRFVLDGQGGVEQKGKGASWCPTRWGLPKLIRQLTATQRKLAPERPGSLVAIPGLNRNFLGYTDNTIIKLVPLTPDHLFSEGKLYSAQLVFERLSAEARSVHDSPR